MDTLKKYGCNLVLFFLLVGAVIPIKKGFSFEDASTASEVLAASYQLGHKIAPKGAEMTITGLEKLLVNCKDNNPAFRIRYRIGMIYFKAGMSKAAKNRFLQITDESDCPLLIRVCSLNMIGQISRMKGKNRQALDAFNQMAELIEQQSTGDKKNFVSAALMKLFCSALLSRAEIHQLQQDYSTSITEYEYLLRALGQYKQGGEFGKYISLAKDRMSQLYLKQGNVGEYIEIARSLPIDFPQYYRAGIIKFEIECVKFLRNASKDFEYSDGSFTAPAQLITYLKSLEYKGSTKKILGKLSQLCKEYSNTYAGILLSYHYAWLLDTVGEKDKAIDVLARVSSTDVGETDNNVQLSVIAETIAEYAKIQRAIMLGEKGDYKKALHVIGSLYLHPEQSHISDLAKSVNESLATLKREVPASVNR